MQVESNARGTIGPAIAAVGAVLTLIGLAGAPAGAISPAGGVAATQNLPLHNDGANAGADCPDDDDDYWHFIIAPNNDQFAFVSIHLNLGTGIQTFSGGDIIPNGSQVDNVFVAVPAGSSLGALVKAGSSADITPPDFDDPPQFNLSHVCEGTTTTSTTTSTSTTAPTTTTSTSTTAPTTSTTSTSTTAPTTTIAPTTTQGGAGGATTTTEGGQGSATTTTTATTTPTDLVTTTERVASGGPTTTGPTTTTTTTLSAQAAVTSTTVAGALPATGAEHRRLVAGGAAMVAFGLMVLLISRRPTTA